MAGSAEHPNTADVFRADSCFEEIVRLEPCGLLIKIITRHTPPLGSAVTAVPQAPRRGIAGDSSEAPKSQTEGKSSPPPAWICPVSPQAGVLSVGDRGQRGLVASDTAVASALGALKCPGSHPSPPSRGSWPFRAPRLLGGLRFSRKATQNTVSSTGSQEPSSLALLLGHWSACCRRQARSQGASKADLRCDPLHTTSHTTEVAPT